MKAFKTIKKEEDMMTPEPIESIDKYLKWGLQALKEKDFKTAFQMFVQTQENEDPAVKQLGLGLEEINKFYWDLQEGRELRAPMKDLESIKLLPELTDLIPIDEEDIEMMREVIDKHGVIVPLLCVQREGEFVLIDGYSRYKLAKELGKRRVPVVLISTFMDMKDLALKLNLCRRHLKPEQRVEIIKKLPLAGRGRPKKMTSDDVIYTKEKVAELMGVSKKTAERAIDTAKGKPKPKPKEKTSQEWLTESGLDLFGKEGRIESMSFVKDYPPDETIFGDIHEQMDKAIRDVLSWLKKKGLKEQVGTFRIKWSFELRKKKGA